MEEIWKDIEFTNGIYQISNYGNARRIENKSNIIEVCKNRHPKPNRKNKNAYMMITIGGSPFYIHRLVAIAFIPNPENKPEVNHIDFNTLNNRVDNLEWLSSKENKLHSKVHMSEAKRGENHPKASMTDETALNIKIDRKNGLKYKELMIKYSLPEHTIANVCTRTYKHVND